jgi:hypothetical protein
LLDIFAFIAMKEEVISWDMGTRNLSYCYLRFPHHILSWGMIDLGTNTASLAVKRLCELLERPEYRWMRDSEADVVIESQPSNGVIKSLSLGLQMYFLTADRCDGRANPRKVSFMSPNNKLKAFPKLWAQMSRVSRPERKRIAMSGTLFVLENTTENNRTYLEYYKKFGYKQRTDMADSLTQGIRFFQIGHPKEVVIDDSTLEGAAIDFVPDNEDTTDEPFEILSPWPSSVS